MTDFVYNIINDFIQDIYVSLSLILLTVKLTYISYSISHVLISEISIYCFSLFLLIPLSIFLLSD